MELKVLKGRIDDDFIEQIVELDKNNMKSILAAAGIDFSEAQRREGLKNSDSTFIIALNVGKATGYLEFTRSRSDIDLIYISSIQIDKKYRNSKVILQLIDEFGNLVKLEEFKGFETNVQKNNFPAIKLYRKIGFEFEENPRNPASWRLRANRKLLKDSPIFSLIERWHGKNESGQ